MVLCNGNIIYRTTKFFRLPPKHSRAAVRIISSDEESYEDCNLDFLDDDFNEGTCQNYGGSDLSQTSERQQSSQEDPTFKPGKKSPKKRKKQKTNLSKKTKKARTVAAKRYFSLFSTCIVVFYRFVNI